MKTSIEKKYLRTPTKQVVAVVRALDEEMKAQSSPHRGRRIAALINHLELANDQARHFGLGEKL